MKMSSGDRTRGQHKSDTAPSNDEYCKVIVIFGWTNEVRDEHMDGASSVRSSMSADTCRGDGKVTQTRRTAKSEQTTGRMAKRQGIRARRRAEVKELKNDKVGHLKADVKKGRIETIHERGTGSCGVSIVRNCAVEAKNTRKNGGNLIVVKSKQKQPKDHRKELLHKLVY
jgi:hypothetical protein